MKKSFWIAWGGSFQPLTADMVKAPNEKKLSPTVVKTEGRYKGLMSVQTKSGARNGWTWVSWLMA